MNIVLADRIAPTPWRNGGGQTRELWVGPNVADWRVRLSLADIAQDGPFSAFPGVQRHFAVVEGAGVMLTLAGREHAVTAGGDPIAFDGALAPGCRLIDGPTRDLNLMLQGGARGTLALAAAERPWQGPHAWRACFVSDPAVLLLPHGEALPLAARCLVTDLPAGPLRLMPSGPGPSFWVGVDGL
ncbi:HutD/Ves family protein [Inhella crocodyli]|uniref:HutD family protein n=1 Tax=Inhella crocodyli TaxID=2499851 RepID=A0A437LI19_9BURK|nr:HutD family protein [Inhella crocodyli]RVT85045.1 HutD family protein [Inhella crocodyli]